jgi:hypothetical protein
MPSAAVRSLLAVLLASRTQSMPKSTARGRVRHVKGTRVLLERVLPRVPPATSVMGVNEGIPPHFEVEASIPPHSEVEARSSPVVRGGKMSALARRLWVTDYRAEYRLEEEGYRANGIYGAMSIAAGMADISTYQDQNRASASSQAARDVKQAAMVMRWCAEATHEVNHGNVPFSIAARSAASMGHKASARSWQASGDVLARDTALKLIAAMVKVRPPPAGQTDMADRLLPV